MPARSVAEDFPTVSQLLYSLTLHTVPTDFPKHKVNEVHDLTHNASLATKYGF
jgi:hypothetical protein